MCVSLSTYHLINSVKIRNHNSRFNDILLFCIWIRSDIFIVSEFVFDYRTTKLLLTGFGNSLIYGVDILKCSGLSYFFSLFIFSLTILLILASTCFISEDYFSFKRTFFEAEFDVLLLWRIGVSIYEFVNGTDYIAPDCVWDACYRRLTTLLANVLS